MKATVKQIFDDIQGLNVSTYSVSSLGSVKSQSSELVGQMIRRSIVGFLPENSLAYKILMDANRFSVKQLWVIAYELVKNENFETVFSE